MQRFKEAAIVSVCPQAYRHYGGYQSRYEDNLGASANDFASSVMPFCSVLFLA